LYERSYADVIVSFLEFERGWWSNTHH